jgi:hypothetical protein
MSRNLNHNVDLLQKREYFNAEFFNISEDTVPATYSTTLLKPMIHNPEKYIMCINRFRVPLSGIPLTKNNIPFNQWQVGLGYFKGTQQQIQLEYVPQINPVTSVLYTYYSLSSNNEIEKLTLQPSASLSRSDINGINYSVLPAYDDTTAYPTVRTFYILSNDNKTVNVYQNGGTGVINTFIGPTTFNTNESFLSIVGICADTNGNFYYGYTTINSINSQQSFYILQYNRTGNSTWEAGLTYVSNSTFNTNGMTFNGLCAQGNNIFIYYNNPPIQPPIINTYYIQWQIGTSAIQTSARVGSNKWVCAADTNYIYRTSSAGVLTAGTTLQNVYTYNNVYSDRLLGFDNNGYLLIHRVQSDLITEIGYQALNITAGGSEATVAYTFTPHEGSYAIINAFSQVIPSDAGKVDIFTYQIFLNQINTAFQQAYNAIQSIYTGAVNGPTQAPRVVYDSATRLFSVICEGNYTLTDSSGNPTFQVFMNQNLWYKFLFPTYATLPNGNNPTKQLLVQNNGINAIQGTGSASLPQFIYVQQEQSTVYSFYDLTRIIITTNQMGVSGDAEAVVTNQNGTSSNNALSIITDIVPDTTTLAPGSDIIYIPAGILRWYNLYNTTPLTKIDLQFYYETKDSSIYPVNIIAGEWFSAKLEFKQVQN